MLPQTRKTSDVFGLLDVFLEALDCRAPHSSLCIFLKCQPKSYYISLSKAVTSIPGVPPRNETKRNTMKTPELSELTAAQMETISGGVQRAPVRRGGGGLIVLLLLLLLLGRRRATGGGMGEPF